MNDFFQDSVFFGASISIISYGIGMLLQRKFKLPFLNPLLISIVITVVVLIVGHIDYDTYYVSAKYLSYLLTPATVCLAVPLYEKFDLLKKNLKAVSIGMGVSEELGGYVNLTVAVIIITGILGNIIAELVCKIFRITEPVAKGIAIGTSAHAIGTAKAMEIGEVEGAMSSLSIGVAGIMTVVGASLFSAIL